MHPSEVGQFSVKSVYFVAREHLGKRNFQITDRRAIWWFVWMAKHVSLECKISNVFWVEFSPVVFEWISSSDDWWEFWVVLFNTISNMSQLEVCLIALWRLWSNRNECFHEGICMTPGTLLGAAIKHATEFLVVCQPDQSLNQVPIVSWIKPAEGLSKINVDASFAVQSRLAKVGVVVYD
ncbi:hypothetical protein DITRI_Ditri16bG0075400 [Diplodiscus trichospermus]